MLEKHMIFILFMRLKMKIAWTSCAKPRFSRKRPEIKNKCTNRLITSCTCKIKQQIMPKHHNKLRSKEIKFDIKLSNMHNFMDNAPFHSNFILESSPIKDLHEYHNELENRWDRKSTSWRTASWNSCYKAQQCLKSLLQCLLRWLMMNWMLQYAWI